MTSTNAPSTTGTLSLRSCPDTSCQFAHSAMTQAATMTTSRPMRRALSALALVHRRFTALTGAGR